MRRLEFCDVCGAATGKAGKGEDSLYLETGAGPFCRGCFDTLTCAITAALADAAAEHAKALKAAVEAAREADAKIAEATHDQVFEDVYKRSGNRGVAVMRAKPCLAVAAAIRARGTP